MRILATKNKLNHPKSSTLAGDSGPIQGSPYKINRPTIDGFEAADQYEKNNHRFPLPTYKLLTD